MFIPEEYLIFYDTTQHSAILRMLRKQKKFLTDKRVSSKFALYQMEQRRDPTSQWISYFDSMPQSYDEFPLLWSEEELSNLQGSPLQIDVKKIKSELNDDYELVANAIPGFRSEYSLKEFIEMWIKVESRQLKNKDFGSYTAPYVDILNHHESPNVAVYYMDGVQVWAKTNVMKGEPLNWNYGDKGNYELLKMYGFVMTDGTQPMTTVIYVDLSDLGEPEELHKLKTKMLPRKKAMVAKLSEDLDSNELMKMVSTMRIKVFDDVTRIDSLKNVAAIYK